jgi:hypothetical protein
VRFDACIAAVALGTLFHGAARGEPSNGSDLDLTWRAQAGCPDAAAMRALIVAAAGEEAVRGSARARAVGDREGRWTVEVDVGDGPRLLRGDTCEEVSRAAALVIGIALRPDGSRRLRPVGTQAGDPEVPWLDPAIDRAAVGARVERRAPVRWRPSVTVHAGAMIGALPDPAPVAGVGLALRGGRVAARIEAMVASSRRGLRLETEDEASVRVDFLAAAGAGCYAARWLWLCGGLEVGVQRAVASASGARVSGAGTWVAGRAGPSTAFPLFRSVDLVLEADAAVPIAYPTFSVNGIPLPGPDPVSFRTSVGVRVAIP